MKLLYISWLDHCSFTNSCWRTKEEYDSLTPPLCETIGWVLREDDDQIILVQTKQIHDDFDDQFCGEMCILKANIKDMKEFKLK